MRWICWASALLAAYGLASLAAAAELAGGAGMMGGCCQHHGTHAAPACGASFYGMQPGCCECPPSACDNAWAGYCQEKARWRAFWYRLGTGGSRCGGPAAIVSEPAGQPIPAVPAEAAEPAGPGEPSALPPLPEPVPEKATWRVPWVR